MKAKSIGISAVIIFIMVYFSAVNANAESQWYLCTVNSAGPHSGTIYINLDEVNSSPAFTKKWFFAPADQTKEMLAVALSSMTNSMNVMIYVDLLSPGVPNLEAFVLWR